MNGRVLLHSSLAGVTLVGILTLLFFVRPAMVTGHALLPVDFIHADHTSVGCIECHHNFADQTGQGFCYACHKDDAAVSADMEEMFHDFCRGCHLEKAADGDDGGPVRVCGECHHDNDAFM